MDNQPQRWVNLSFAAFCGLVMYVVFELAQKVVGIYDLEAQIPNIDLIVRAFSLVVGVGLFIFFYKKEEINQFMNEVVIELSHVTWPLRTNTAKSTVVVVIMVVIAGLFLGGMDSIWSRVLKWMI